MGIVPRAVYHSDHNNQKAEADRRNGDMMCQEVDTFLCIQTGEAQEDNDLYRIREVVRGDSHHNHGGLGVEGENCNPDILWVREVAGNPEVVDSHSGCLEEGGVPKVPFLLSEVGFWGVREGSRVVYDQLVGTRMNVVRH